MDDDLRRNLLPKKNANFDRAYEECVVKIQRIKQRNDVMQKQIGTQIQASIRQEVNNQKEFILKEISELKKIIQQMQQKYKDPESKNKIKKIKQDAHKQIERNKIILKDLINKSFAVRSSSGKQNQEQNTQNLIEGGKVNYNHLEEQRNNEEHLRQSLITDQQLQIDYDIQRKIMLEKNQMINEVEQSAYRINQIMNDMALQINQQGQNLDIIQQELLKTNQNVMAANKQLQQASTLQKKGRKKYVILIAIIVIVLIAVAGVLAITLS